jgi:hypothetical protein
MLGGSQTQGMVMTIPRSIRNVLLVEARHRCTICAEKCFEIHHIVELSDGGTDDEDNLIVLCPNCHQHRYHRHGEFTREQLKVYKTKLKETNEIERRLLLNLEEIKSNIGEVASSELEAQLHEELSKSAELIDPSRSPTLHNTVVQTAKELAQEKELPGGARRAIEVQFEIERQKAKAKLPLVEILEVDENAYQKSNEFPAAYVFGLVLNRVPHPDWVQVFDQEYKNSLYMMKRKTRIVRDRIRMIVANTDNLQNHVAFAKRLVDSTNNFVQTRGFSQIDRQIDSAKAQALAEYDAIQSLKQQTEGLRI